MNGGSYDYVMGNMVNTSGTFYSSSSGFSSPYPDSKYYDKYSYSTSSKSVASYSRSKIGDGIKETIQIIRGSYGMEIRFGRPTLVFLAHSVSMALLLDTTHLALF